MKKWIHKYDSYSTYPKKLEKDQFFYGLSLFAKHFLIFVSILVKSLSTFSLFFFNSSPIFYWDRPGKGKRWEVVGSDI